MVYTGLVLFEQRDEEETAMHERLRREVRAGFEAIELGELAELRDEELDGYVERLGDMAAGGRD